jgi:cob(I)alamin adenosyltransferase
MSDTPTDAPPTEHQEPPELRRAESLVLVNTGNGKGKSTAAFGTMIRSVARGWPVAVVQFLKSGQWNTGEEKVARDLGVEWFAIGEGFTWDSEDLSRDEAVAQEAWRQAATLLAGGTHRLVILDEITYPMNWGWFDTDEVVAAIRDRAPKVNVICTGRDAPEPLLELADTATEMQVLKHAYQSGIRAMKGIDY